MDLSIETINEFFVYKDGNLLNKIGRGTTAKKGEIAGRKDSNGYRQITFNKKSYQAHRIIYFMHHGYVPKIIDHINGNPSDNHIENLRDVTVEQNQHNAKLRLDNTSGYKNVTLDKRSNKWYVQINVNGKHKHIGYFQDLELADLVAQEARDLYHGQYARDR